MEKMHKYLMILMMTLFTIGVSMAQEVEDEIDFKYVKAKYLLETERYEDAIVALTEIIKENPAYAKAMIMRAKAKYAMAAYAGTKKDVLVDVGNNGITEMGTVLLGKADYKMGNKKAALNSLVAATKMGTEDAQVWEFTGNLYQEDGKLLKACDFWQEAAAKGSSKARINAKKLCGSTEPIETSNKDDKPSRHKTNAKIDYPTKSETKDRDVEDDRPPMKDTRTPEQKRRDEDDSLNAPTKGKVLKNGGSTTETKPSDDKKEDPADDKPARDEEIGEYPSEDNTPNKIKVDEELSLIIRGQGLGKRKVLDQPNILILSDQDGKVAIDICVNKRGKVESAEFNGKLSTIAKKSLVSLAIRKSKDFWFEKNDFTEQCGVIIFDITTN